MPIQLQEENGGKILIVNVSGKLTKTVSRTPRIPGFFRTLRRGFFIGDQTDREFLSKVAAERGPFDVIVDDGGHKPKQQRISFETLWPHLRSPGCYCVEDLNMGYWVSFSGLGAFSGGFMKYAHRLTHLLNGYWHRLHPSSFWYRTPAMTRELTKVTFWDSMVFVHKGEHRTPITVASEKEL